MEAYADPLQYFEPDPPNETKPEEVLAKLKGNDSSLKVYIYSALSYSESKSILSHPNLT